MYDYLRCRPVAVLMYIKNRIVNSLNADSQQTRCGGFRGRKTCFESDGCCSYLKKYILWVYESIYFWCMEVYTFECKSIYFLHIRTIVSWWHYILYTLNRCVLIEMVFSIGLITKSSFFLTSPLLSNRYSAVSPMFSVW